LTGRHGFSGIFNADNMRLSNWTYCRYSADSTNNVSPNEASPNDVLPNDVIPLNNVSPNEISPHDVIPLNDVSPKVGPKEESHYTYIVPT
jgi:hypothetical protein